MSSKKRSRSNYDVHGNKIHHRRKTRNAADASGARPNPYKDPRERDRTQAELVLVKLEDTTREMFMVDGNLDDIDIAGQRDSSDCELKVRDAVPPPPGYRYLPDGRMVPFIRAQIPLSDDLGRKLFCEVLQVTGSFRCACDALCIPDPRTVRSLMAKDILLAEMIEGAADRHREVLYAAAYQRATKGVRVPIIGGKDKDKIVGYEVRYSDSLLTLLLKRHFPEFRTADQKQALNQTNNNTTNNLVVNMPDARLMSREQRDAARLLLGTGASPPQEIDKSGVIDVVDLSEEPKDS